MRGNRVVWASIVVVGMLLGGVGANPTARALPVRSSVLVGATAPGQVRMLRWAIERFERAGLGAPAALVTFHPDPAACGGRLGREELGVVDLCMRHVDALTRQTTLHELSHAWLEQHLSPAVRARFLALRGLRSWNDPRYPWQLRGTEQAAEAVVWAIGDRGFAPSIPDNGPEAMARAYRLLTGRSCPSTCGGSA